MSHHGSGMMRISEEMEIAAQQQDLGSTGCHPLGRVHDQDEGEIKMAVSHDAANLKVYLHFGKKVTWMGMTPDQARDLGQALIDKSLAVRGITT